MSKLNLGCGNDCLKEYVNHDIIRHREEIEEWFDLNNKEWEFNFYKEWDEIRAWDVIEHLNNPINFMNNCWMLLKEGGILDLKACGWQNPNYWIDITHKKGYDIRSFDYFVPTTSIGSQYSYYTTKKWKYLDGYPKFDKHKNIIVKMTPIK